MTTAKPFQKGPHSILTEPACRTCSSFCVPSSLPCGWACPPSSSTVQRRRRLRTAAERRTSLDVLLGVEEGDNGCFCGTLRKLWCLYSSPYEDSLLVYLMYLSLQATRKKEPVSKRATLSTKKTSPRFQAQKSRSGLRKQPTFKEIAAHQDRQKLH